MAFARSEVIQTAMSCCIKKGEGDYSASLPGRFSPDKVLCVRKSLLFNGRMDDLSSVVSRPVREADSPNLGPRMKMGGTTPPFLVRM